LPGELKKTADINQLFFLCCFIGHVV